MPRRSTLIYPVPPTPRTAVLGGWFRPAGPVRVFPGGWNREAAEFAQSIAARREQLEELIGIADPTHALILIRYEWEDAIPWRARRRLWDAFGVPLFEQIVDASGDLLAAECEAHQGFARSFAPFRGGGSRSGPDAVRLRQNISAADRGGSA